MTKLKTKTLNKQQKQLLSLLYKFRYLTVNQLLKYFKHKDPHRIRVWLNDLMIRKYIAVIKDKHDPTKPFVYCLDTQAKYTLLENPDYDKDFLGRLYKEKKLKEKFRNHNLFLFDIYLYFLLRQEKDTTLHFLTQQDLKGYDFFPKELPDVYIATETSEGTDKYFLDLFDEYRKPAGLSRFAVRNYITYCEEGSWQANTNNSPFPSILFVQPDERRMSHIRYYAKAKLEKSFEDINIFQTTQDTIRFSKSNKNIWKQII